MEIRRIMVGVDFSPQGELALEQALDVARFTGAEVVLAHVTHVPEPPDPTGLPESSARAMAEYHRLLSEHLQESRAQLDEVRERVSGQGVDVSQVVIDGYPDEALARAAGELGADLIAVGTHGRTGIGRFWLGSVAERVVRLTRASVLVARPGSKGRGGFQRILVPTDFSAHSEEALEVALVLAANGATVDLLHCWEVPALLLGHVTPSAEEKAIAPVFRSLEESARARGRELCERHRREGVTLEFSTAEVSPSRGIRERAGAYDLVVMGSHGRRGARRFLLGSVAEVTVRHAPCSVVVVHRTDESSGG